MKPLVYIFTSALVMALAFWAYNQNYKTQAALKEARLLQNDIAALRERLSVLRAEWAYLNRPDRLRDLAYLNFDRLRLFPLAPEQFGAIEQVAFPDLAEDAADAVIDAALNVRGTLPETRP